MDRQRCELLIDLGQLRRNASLLRGFLPPQVALMAVTKADAYGHGTVQAGKAFLSGGAARLAVATPEEGLALRAGGIDAPVLVLGPPIPEDTETAEACAEAGLALTAFDAATLRALHAAGEKVHKPIAIHLKLDTGMARLGVRDGGTLAELARLTRSLPGLRLEGIYTHLSCADEPQDAYTALQLSRWREALRGIPTEGLTLHAANSAATLRYPDTRLQAVRCGIALYGSPGVESPLPLAPAQRWSCRIARVETLPAGEYIGYGATHRTARETRLVTLPVGYGDGYRRAFSNRAQVLIGGRRAPILGRVCMDLCMADATGIPGVAAGDEAVLLGSQGGERITPEEMAGWMDSIPYEAMLSPGPRVPRRYIDS